MILVLARIARMDFDTALELSLEETQEWYDDALYLEGEINRWQNQSA